MGHLLNDSDEVFQNLLTMARSLFPIDYDSCC